jgi:hypothetical protein
VPRAEALRHFLHDRSQLIRSGLVGGEIRRRRDNQARPQAAFEKARLALFHNPEEFAPLRSPHGHGVRYPDDAAVRKIQSNQWKWMGAAAFTALPAGPKSVFQQPLVKNYQLELCANEGSTTPDNGGRPRASSRARDRSEFRKKWRL